MAEHFFDVVIEPITMEIKDNSLALSRRLDWRFVFSNPHLHRVVVAGQMDNDLLEALQMLSDRVISWRGQPVDACDMLVLRNPSLSKCRDALKAVRPERFYIESEDHSRFLHLRNVIALAYCIIVARRNGYYSVRSFWHWPDIANANRIIPLSQSEALSFVAAKGRSGFMTSLKIAGLNLLRRTGLLAVIINNLGIAGERLL